jgi:hypothetical protein
MKAIMVIFIRTPEVKPRARPPAVPMSESLQWLKVLSADKTNQNKATIGNKSVPAFWTWFIENPRPRFEILR